MARSRYKHQLDTLINRDLSVLFGSLPTLLLLLVQAPIIGYFIGLAWENKEANERTYFVMSIAIIWMGCINACCSIVRERPVFDRDRMFNLDIRSYIVSKITVLAVMGTMQVIIFLMVQGQLMRLPGSLMLHAAYCVVMIFSTVTASSLGLLISTVAKTSYAAVVAVPIIMMPQIIFSEVVLGRNIQDRIPSLIENLTITKWCYQALVTLGSSDIDSEVLMKSGVALTFGSGLFLVLSAIKLKVDDW